jgi:hypothetical protein
MNADSAFVYHSISDQLDAIAPYTGSDHVPITVSYDGNWYAFTSTRFDNENGGWSDLVIVKSDYTEYEVIKLNGNLIHSTGRAMIFNNGNSIVFVSEDLGNHSKDVFVIHKNGNTWGDTVNLTQNSSYNYNYFPTISPDGTKVLFDASPSSYPSMAIGKVNIDGTDLSFPIVAGQNEEAHSGSYNPNGAIVYEGSNDESIWKLVQGTTTPVRITADQSNDNTPFVLPDGRIVSLKLPNSTHQIKIMNANGTDNHMLSDESSSSFNEVYDLGLSGYESNNSDDTQAPTVPQNLNATAVSESQINLTWNAATDNIGIAGYKIFRDNILVDTAVNSTSYNNTGLDADTEYNYTVSAFDAAGNESDKSSSTSATTKPNSITDINTSSVINIYPNPVSEKVHINFKEINILKIEISNTSGKILFKRNNIQNSEIIDVSNFKNGLYFIKITSTKGYYIQKFIKKQFY